MYGTSSDRGVGDESSRDLRHWAYRLFLPELKDYKGNHRIGIPHGRLNKQDALGKEYSCVIRR